MCGFLYDTFVEVRCFFFLNYKTHIGRAVTVTCCESSVLRAVSGPVEKVSNYLPFDSSNSHSPPFLTNITCAVQTVSLDTLNDFAIPIAEVPEIHALNPWPLRSC